MARSISVQKASFTETVINRSRFISQCFPVESEEEALALLASVRARYPDASHTCFAYRTGERAQTARYSDAGEPSGTAGMPILEVLRTNGVTDALITVTRYFGGVLLGTGGLARAYGGGALDALRASGLVERVDAVRFLLNIDYPRYGALEGYIRKSARVDAVDFTDTVTVRATVEKSLADSFEADIIERSDGRVKPVREGECLLERGIA